VVAGVYHDPDARKDYGLRGSEVPRYSSYCKKGEILTVSETLSPTAGSCAARLPPVPVAFVELENVKVVAVRGVIVNNPLNALCELPLMVAVSVIRPY
jgi:hypothetical protein